MKSVYLRKAEISDMKLLYTWANDPIVRQNSFNTATILLEDHMKWFNRIMNDDNVIQYILMSEDIPIGQIRLNIEGTTAEIGYSIGAEYRGCGYGHKILKLMINEIKDTRPEVKELVAKVKPGNIASKSLFEDEGYELEYCCYSLNMD